MWELFRINSTFGTNKTLNANDASVSDFGSFITFFIVYLFGLTMLYFFCKIYSEYSQSAEVLAAEINQSEKPPEYEHPPHYDSIPTTPNSLLGEA